MTDWLLILAVCTALYALVRLGFRAADAATASLTDGMDRRESEPTHSITRKECAWCGRLQSESREPYDPKIGALSVSHDICGTCLDTHYPLVECELDEAPRVVAERCTVLRGEVA